MTADPEEFPANVTGSNRGPIPHLSCALSLKRTLAHLNDVLGEHCQQIDIQIHVSGGPTQQEFTPSERKTVLIVLADERELFDADRLPPGYIVFKSYSAKHQKGSRAHPFPVGYFDGVGRTPPVAFGQRSVNVFFSGFLNRNRVDLYKQFRPIPWLPKHNLKHRHTREFASRLVNHFCKERIFSDLYPASQIKFTEGFAQGLDPAEYASLLANTRIAICPPGFVSHETIRHWEAMRLGCVILSAPLPSNRFYRNSPIMQLQDWSHLDSVLRGLLDDPVKMMAIHLESLRWWQDVCSEKAVGRYMADIILNQPAA